MVRARGYVAPDTDLLVLLSGGRDSSCLLDVLTEIYGAARVSALHLNYGLRDEADDDERWCRELSDRLGVGLTVERAPAPPPVGNRQAWARELRFAAAQRVRGERLVAVGHTRTDQLETVLYRLVSSPSRRALRGMRPLSGWLLRPLLDFTRAQTAAYCDARGLAYRDDPTNASGTYVRNRIRHELIPLLNELHPGAERNILALAEILAAEGELLDQLVEQLLAGRTSVPLAELRGLPRASSNLLIQRLADQVTAPAPAAGVARRAGEVLAMSENAHLDLPGGVRATTEAGMLRFQRTPRHNH